MAQAILTRKSFLNVAELFFAESCEVKADVVRYNFCSVPVAGLRSLPHYTIGLDLGKSEEQLLRGIKSNCRYDLRRAERDGLQCEFRRGDGSAAVQEFCEFYDQFAASRGLLPANRARLRALADAGVLEINSVRQGADVLSWHVNCRSNGKHLHMYGCSFFRQADSARRALIGRANRFLFWQEILRAKQEGLQWFDFGGWYAGLEDQQQLQINQFKESWGGTVIPTYNVLQAITLKGRLGLQFLRLKRRWAGVTSPRLPESISSPPPSLEAAT